jgi:hypothetical protein
MTLKGFRRMVIVDETMETEGGFRPHLIFENDTEMTALPGGSAKFAPSAVWGPTLADAKAEALNYNMGYLSLTQADMDEILSSVMAASERKQREREENEAFPQTMKFIRDGEAAIEHMSGYNIRPGGRS